MIKVSLITVTKNSSATIVDTLNSVKNQTYKNIEYIIIDGLSTDNTIEIINSSNTIIDKFLSEKDDGIYHAMNKGLSLATGDIIGFLNSDDIFADNEVIQKIVEAFEKNQVECVYSNIYYRDHYNNIKRVWKAGKFNNLSFYLGWMPPHPTFWVDKSVYKKYGGFDLRFKFSGDYEIMLRFLLKHKIKWHFLDEFTVIMKTGGASNASIKNRLLANSEDHMAWLVNNKSSFCQLIRIFKPIRKLPQFVYGKKNILPTY